MNPVRRRRYLGGVDRNSIVHRKVVKYKIDKEVNEEKGIGLERNETTYLVRLEREDQGYKGINKRLVLSMP